MKLNGTMRILAVVASILIIAAPAMAAAQGAGARSGEVGWQYDAFSQNLDVEVTPQEPTTKDRIEVTITSKVGEVWIRQASVFGVIYPNDGIQFPFTFPFQRISDTVFECAIEPFPLNGYRVDFYIVAYDYFYGPMDSRNSMSFSYDVVGSGWRYSAFDDNIELAYSPLRANASEEVVVRLRSVENITISGANLYITFQTPGGEVSEGGWNFSKSNANSTEMRRAITGFPAGTNVTFWVTAWDQYNTVITSRMYNYSVMGMAEYTNFPFEYSDATGDKRIWVPGDSILLPMAGMSAMAIPLFVYLHAINLRRRKRAVDLIKAKEEPGEAMPDE